MKLTGLSLVAAIVLKGVSGIAPPTPVTASSADISNIGSSAIALFSEHFCNDLTETDCRNKGGYWMRYSVYDPVTSSCVCSTKPSDYIVCLFFALWPPAQI